VRNIFQKTPVSCIIKPRFMKTRLLPALLVLAIIALVSYRPGAAKQHTVNPVIGDVSYVSRFGQAPDCNVNEQDRIQTHLLYAEQLLRGKDSHHLSAAQRQKRYHLLNLLHQYALAGRFPENKDYPGERKPCFIDAAGTICAVGYLVEQTAGREVAEAINKKHQYETIDEMKDDALLRQWVSESGLTLKECATIQPTYQNPNPGDDRRDDYISTSYGITTGLSAGANIAFNAINKFQIQHGGRSKLVPILGLASGAFSIYNGIRHFPKKPEDGFFYNDPNDTKKLMSAGNIALGSVTMIMSAWNLIKNKKPVPPKTSWTPYSAPMQNGRMAYGLSLTKKIG
jgi:hypothetical protein